MGVHAGASGVASPLSTLGIQVGGESVATLGVQAGAAGMLPFASWSISERGGGTGRLRSFSTLGVQLGASGGTSSEKHAAESGGGLSCGAGPRCATCPEDSISARDILTL